MRDKIKDKQYFEDLLKEEEKTLKCFLIHLFYLFLQQNNGIEQ